MDNFYEGPKIGGVGQLVSASCPLDVAIGNMNKKAAEPISLRDYALIFNKICPVRPMSPFGNIAFDGGFVKEAVITIPKGSTLLVRNSPIIKEAQKITIELKERYAARVSPGENWEKYKQWHANFHAGPTLYIKPEEFIALAERDKNKKITEKEVYALKDSLEKVMKERELYEIPAKRFGEDEITIWAFRDQAKLHGERLSDLGVKEVFFGVWTKYDVENSGNIKILGPFAKQIWYSPIERQLNTCEGTNDKLIHTSPGRGILGLIAEKREN